MIDVTVAISPALPTWPGDPGISIDATDRIARGDAANVSRYCLGSHTGTHVDPPCHFVEGGLTIDALPLEVLVGPARVVDMAHVATVIGAADLAAAGIPADTRRLLLKTRNSARWGDYRQPFRRDFVHLDPSAARWLVERGVRLVGIDYLSIEGFDAAGHPVHQALLGAGVIIVEGLDLRRAAPGEYQLVCLPLKVAGGDGGPARVILI